MNQFGPSIDKFLTAERTQIGAASRFLLGIPSAIQSQFNYIKNFDGQGVMKSLFGRHPAPIGRGTAVRGGNRANSRRA